MANSRHGNRHARTTWSDHGNPFDDQDLERKRCVREGHDALFEAQKAAIDLSGGQAVALSFSLPELWPDRERGSPKRLAQGDKAPS